MSATMIIELQNAQGVQTVHAAIEAYKVRLQTNVTRTKRHLAEFEQRYQVDTDHFLTSMVAEDLVGGDMEYIEWAGEAKLLAALETELKELNHANYQLP